MYKMNDIMFIYLIYAGIASELIYIFLINLFLELFRGSEAGCKQGPGWPMDRNGRTMKYTEKISKYYEEEQNCEEFQITYSIRKFQFTK